MAARWHTTPSIGADDRRGQFRPQVSESVTRRLLISRAINAHFLGTGAAGGRSPPYRCPSVGDLGARRASHALGSITRLTDLHREFFGSPRGKCMLPHARILGQTLLEVGAWPTMPT